VKYWETIADNLSKAGFTWGVITSIESEGRTLWLLMLTVTENVSLCARMKSWQRFWNSHGRFELDTKGGGQNRLLRRELKSES
jgi:hypothetical protein